MNKCYTNKRLVPLLFIDLSHECGDCGNWWSIREGFDLPTNKCYTCKKWDDDEPKRKKEQQERAEWEKIKYGFEYVPGDPFW